MPRILYNAQGQAVPVDEAEAQRRLLSEDPAEQLFFKRGERVAVMSPDGRIGTTSEENLYDWLPKGWKLASDDEVKGARERRQFGTPGQQATTFVEGALSGATMGGSELVQKAAGFGENAAARARVNPGTKLAGEGAGILGTELLSAGVAPTGEVGALRAAARLTPTGAISRGAHAAVEALGGGRAARIGVSAAETGLFGAAQEMKEEALEGRPVDVEKIASAASLAALVGGSTTGFLEVAGVIGRGALRAGEVFPTTKSAKVTPGTIESAAEAVAAKKEADPTTVVGRLVDALVGKDRRAAAGRLLKDRGLRDLARTAESDANLAFIEGGQAFRDHVKEFGEAAWSITDHVKPSEIKAGLAGLAADVPRAQALDTAYAIRAAVETMRANPADFHGVKTIAQLRTIGRQMERELGIVRTKGGLAFSKKLAAPTAEDVFNVLNKTKRRLDVPAKFDEAFGLETRAAATLAKDQRKRIALILEDANVFGGAATAQSKYNRLAEEWIESVEGFLDQKGLGIRDGFYSGKPSFDINTATVEDFFRKLGDPGNELRRERFVQYLTASKRIADELTGDAALQQRLASTVHKTENLSRLSRAMADLRSLRSKSAMAEQILGSAIARGLVGGYVAGPLGIAAAVAGPAVVSSVVQLLDHVITRQGTAIAKLATRVATSKPLKEFAAVGTYKALEKYRYTDHSYPKPAKDAREAHARRTTEIAALAADPARAQEALTRSVQPLMAEAPMHAQALVQKGMNDIAFLASKIPAEPPRSILAPATSRPAVGDEEIAKFARYFRAVSDPVTVLEDLASGRLSPEAMEAVQATNPALYEEMKAAVLSALDVEDKLPPYETRVQLALFLGIVTDPTLEPTFIAALQASYAPVDGGGGEGGGEGVKLKSTKDLKSAKHAQSAMERLEARGIMT